MRAIIKRLNRLEETSVPEADRQSERLAAVIWERRHRRLTAAGQPTGTPPPPHQSCPQLRRLSIAETLRLRRDRIVL